MAHLVQAAAEACVIDAAVHVALLLRRHRSLEPWKRGGERADLRQSAADEFAIRDRNFTGRMTPVLGIGREYQQQCRQIRAVRVRRQVPRDLDHPGDLGPHDTCKGCRDLPRNRDSEHKFGEELVHPQFAYALQNLKLETGVEAITELVRAPTDGVYQVAPKFVAGDALRVQPRGRMQQQLGGRVENR